MLRAKVLPEVLGQIVDDEVTACMCVLSVALLFVSRQFGVCRREESDTLVLVFYRKATERHARDGAVCFLHCSRVSDLCFIRAD